MNLLPYRRKLNDSYLGRMINHSFPGIVVEGISRFTGDLLDDAPFFWKYFWNPNTESVAYEDLERTRRKMAYESHPENHYAETSPLWQDHFHKGRKKKLRLPFSEVLKRWQEQQDRTENAILQRVFPYW